MKLLRTRLLMSSALAATLAMTVFTGVVAAKAAANQSALDLILVDPVVGGLNGGKFQLKNSDGRTVFIGTTSTVQGAAGTICVDDLPAGTYTWTELKRPKGFVNNGPASQSVTTVSQPGSCTTGLGGFGVTVFFNGPAS